MLVCVCVRASACVFTDINMKMPFNTTETLRAWLLSALVVHGAVGGNPDAKRLYDDLLSNYNKLVRPVVNTSDVLKVSIKLKLSQLIDVVSSLFLYFQPLQQAHSLSVYLSVVLGSYLIFLFEINSHALACKHGVENLTLPVYSKNKINLYR